MNTTRKGKAVACNCWVGTAYTEVLYIECQPLTVSHPRLRRPSLGVRQQGSSNLGGGGGGVSSGCLSEEGF